MSIVFSMAGDGIAKVALFNSAGDLTGSIEESLPAGPQTVKADIAGYAPGAYFYAVSIRYGDGRREGQAVHKFAVVR